MCRVTIHGDPYGVRVRFRKRIIDGDSRSRVISTVADSLVSGRVMFAFMGVLASKAVMSAGFSS